MGGLNTFLPDNMPNPLLAVNQVGDSIADAVGTPAQVILSLKGSVKGLTSSLARDASAGKPPPEPVGAVGNAVSSAIGVVQGNLDAVGTRLRSFGK